jgi:hypothetical protein
MNQGTEWVLLMKINKSKKSRASVPLSSDLQNLCIPRKTSREYILLSTFEQKTAFSAIYKPKHARNPPFFRRFCLFRAALKVYLASVIPSTTSSLDWALPLPIVGAPSSSGATHTVSSSF